MIFVADGLCIKPGKIALGWGTISALSFSLCSGLCILSLSFSVFSTMSSFLSQSSSFTFTFQIHFHYLVFHILTPHDSLYKCNLHSCTSLILGCRLYRWLNFKCCSLYSPFQCVKTSAYNMATVGLDLILSGYFIAHSLNLFLPTGDKECNQIFYWLIIANKWMPELPTSCCHDRQNGDKEIKLLWLAG